MTVQWSVADAVVALLLAVALLVAVRTWSTGSRRAHTSPAVTALVLVAALAITLAARPLPDAVTLVGAAALVAVEALLLAVRRRGPPRTRR